MHTIQISVVLCLATCDRDGFGRLKVGALCLHCHGSVQHMSALHEELTLICFSEITKAGLRQLGREPAKRHGGGGGGQLAWKSG